MDPTTKKVADNSGEDSGDSQKFTDHIHNVSVEIAITLNILEEEDTQSWMYKNIQWIFSGVGVSFFGVIFGLLKKWKDKNSKNEIPENN